MKFLFCVDDTDDLTKSTSTGRIAEYVKSMVEKIGGKIDKGITRHQLLIDEKISYTSHNSSMCFAADIPNDMFEEVKIQAVNILKNNMAETASPGMCFCRLDILENIDDLIHFGLRAQTEVITKEEAYRVADNNSAIWLKEFGGSGNGVIGALAGIGLRLSGNDGTFRGKVKLEENNIWISVGKLCKEINIDAIVDMDSQILSADTEIFVDGFIKKVFLNHKSMAVAKLKKGFGYIACKKPDLYSGSHKSGNWNFNCQNFEFDNDYEEQFNDHEKVCYNCLYRRWTKDGFECLKIKE